MAAGAIPSDTIFVEIPLPDGGTRCDLPEKDISTASSAPSFSLE
jgi:hypothetical protein